METINKIEKIIMSMWVVFVIGYLSLVGWSVDFLLSFFDKDIPFVADFIIGLFLGAVTISIAIVMKIIGLF